MVKNQYFRWEALKLADIIECGRTVNTEALECEAYGLLNFKGRVLSIRTCSMVSGKLKIHHFAPKARANTYNRRVPWEQKVQWAIVSPECASEETLASTISQKVPRILARNT